MEKERQNFVYGNEAEGVPGCIANGIDEATANKIYDEMIDFAKYAFNKSHAAAYAVIDLSSFLSVHFGRTIKSFGMIIPPVKHLLVNIVIIINIAYSNFDFCNHCYDIKYSYTGLTLI